eukprot:6014552-Amphidinium_carterae.1
MVTIDYQPLSNARFSCTDNSPFQWFAVAKIIRRIRRMHSEGCLFCVRILRVRIAPAALAPMAELPCVMANAFGWTRVRG